MNPTKALTSLGLVTGRGMDNGAAGALMLANQVTTGSIDSKLCFQEQACKFKLNLTRNWLVARKIQV